MLNNWYWGVVLNSRAQSLIIKDLEMESHLTSLYLFVCYIYKVTLLATVVSQIRDVSSWYWNCPAQATDPQIVPLPFPAFLQIYVSHEVLPHLTPHLCFLSHLILSQRPLLSPAWAYHPNPALPTSDSRLLWLCRLPSEGLVLRNLAGAKSLSSQNPLTHTVELCFVSIHSLTK